MERCAFEHVTCARKPARPPQIVNTDREILGRLTPPTAPGPPGRQAGPRGGLGCLPVNEHRQRLNPAGRAAGMVSLARSWRDWTALGRLRRRLRVILALLRATLHRFLTTISAPQ